MTSVRNLIVCADGTWSSPNSRDRGVYAPSNVVKMVKALRHGAIADLPATDVLPAISEQLVFYDRGVGTGGWLDRLVGGATGKGLEQNVRDGYHFLVKAYQPGDRIFLVGFSRGAYTVRRLAGFIGRFGLLDAEQFRADATDESLTIAIKSLYQEFGQLTESSPAQPPADNGSRRVVAIEALCVWDTVGALGLPEHPLLDMLLGFTNRREHEFIDNKLSAQVLHAYHALALDEPRAAFRPALWRYDPVRVQNGTLQQVWFAGAHSNVGGNYQECGLSDTAFYWMANRLKGHRVAFREDYLTQRIQPDPWGEVRNPRQGLLASLLFPHKLLRVPEEGTFLHPSVGDRGIPNSFYNYQVAPGQPVYKAEYGLYTNAPPASGSTNAQAAS